MIGKSFIALFPWQDGAQRTRWGPSWTTVCEVADSFHRSVPLRRLRYEGRKALSKPSFQRQLGWRFWKRHLRTCQGFLWFRDTCFRRCCLHSCTLWRRKGQQGRISGGCPGEGNHRLLWRSYGKNKFVMIAYKMTVSSVRVDFLLVPPKLWTMFSIGIFKRFFD